MMFNRKLLTITLGFLCFSIIQVSCASTKLRCAGCNISEAYSKPLAQKLVVAVIQGKTGKVAELVQEGANPNYLEPEKIPMLIWALCANNIEGFETLLKVGADPNLSGTGHGFGNGKLGGLQGAQGNDFSQIYEGWSAMRFASQVKDIQFLKLAIQYGGDVNAPKGQRSPKEPLIAAAEYGLFEHVKLLVSAGANINIHSEIESAPESAISGMGRFDIAIWFLEHGYNYNLQRLAVRAENRGVNTQQSNKEKLIDMLIAKGIKFPVTETYRNLHKYREVPPSALMDVVYGRKDCRDFPLKPGRWNDKSCWGAPIPD
ncbi:ankyrin repeat domain-containing protein [Leptospira koniambonensis]|uniref:Ankyrin repeat domain-containing protein n=1 Tax=Leptospira koniambonensis TaxID=2484950 RepID=A0A4V3JN33_9LEPT|nr:ankyrin repeat domain-containing protein [Leptospira koniambonensis]TGL32565.1 ankyrin repeat domain-containing protein [Leptospira koniambonensis]